MITEDDIKYFIERLGGMEAYKTIRKSLYKSLIKKIIEKISEDPRFYQRLLEILKE